MTCARASHFGVRMRISFWCAHAHLIVTCVRASHVGLRMRISFWYVHAQLILVCACASHFVVRMRISYVDAHRHVIFWSRKWWKVFLRMLLTFEKHYLGERILRFAEKLLALIIINFCKRNQLTKSLFLSGIVQISF